MPDLEELKENRFYKLKPQWNNKCSCGGLLWLNMKAGSVNEKCRHVGCMKEFDVSRICDTCNNTFEFDDALCTECEPIVIELTQCKTNMIDADKVLKKANRAFKAGDISETEWKKVTKDLKEESLRCELKVEEILGRYTN